MINIIRNCSHYSDIYTGIKTDENGSPVSILRKTFSRIGAMALSREFHGLLKYCECQGVASSTHILNFRVLHSYGILEFKYRKGLAGNYMMPLDKNYRKLENLIAYYKKVFCNGRATICHGDFSIGNVLFENGLVKWIIDWENANNIMPRSYDLIYCITENALFSLAKKGELSESEISAYNVLFRRIEKEIGFDYKAKKAPGRWCLDMAVYYAEKTGVNHNKCPFIAYNQDVNTGNIIDKLDELLKS